MYLLSAGFQGKGLALNLTRLSEKDKLIYKIGYETHKVNQLVSDMIPLRREILLEIPEYAINAFLCFNNYAH